MSAPNTAALRRLRRGQRLELNGRVFKVTGYAPRSTPERMRIGLIAGFGEDYELVVPQSGPALFQPVLLPLSNTQRVNAVLIDGVVPNPPKKPATRKASRPAAKKTSKRRASKKAAKKSTARRTTQDLSPIQALASGALFETTTGLLGTYNGVYKLNNSLHRVTWDKPQDGTVRGLMLGATPVHKREGRNKAGSKNKTTRTTKAKKAAKDKTPARKAPAKKTPARKATTKKRAAKKTPTRKASVPRQRAYKETANGRGGHTPGVFDDESWTTGVPIVRLDELAPGERFRFQSGVPWIYVGRSDKGAHLARNDQGEQDEFFGGSKVQLLGDDDAEDRATKLAAFEDKEERRVERLRTRARKKRAASDAAYGASKAITDRIPMGQPILVDHHSAPRHRRDLGRSDRKMRQSIELRRAADALERRAESAGGSISSDDPTAIQQLRAKIADEEASIERIKAINKAIGSPRHASKRTPKQDIRARQRLTDLGLKEGRIDSLMTPDPFGRVGYPSYVLSNARGRIKQARNRIEKLQRDAVNEGERDVRYPSTVGEVRVVQQGNRIRIFFPEKPHFTLRQKLGKSGAGFRWAPSQGAWQRFPNDYAWQEANKLAQEYAAHPPDYVESREMERLQKEILKAKDPRYRVHSDLLDRWKRDLETLIAKAKAKAS